MFIKITRVKINLINFIYIYAHKLISTKVDYLQSLIQLILHLFLILALKLEKDKELIEPRLNYIRNEC